MRNDYTKKIALCGLMAALAIVVMCLGGMIPFATYVCPVVCTLIGSLILKSCGKSFAWSWYCVVSVLSMLFAPDKEAAVVYIFLGFYPYIKPFMDGTKLRVLLKFLYFNISTLIAYILLLWIFGLTEILQDYMQIGTVGLIIVLILGNITFFMLDSLLGRSIKRK